MSHVGNVDIDAKNITIKKGISDVTGAISLTGTESVDLQDILTSTGNIDIDAVTTLVATKAITSTAGTVALDAGDKITLGSDANIIADKAVDIGKYKTGKLETAGDIKSTSGDITLHSEAKLTTNVTFTSASGDIKTKKELDANNHSIDIATTKGGINLEENVLNATTITLDANQNIVTRGLGAAGKISLDADLGKVEVIGNIESTGTNGDIEILANTNKIIKVKGNITSTDGKVTIAKLEDNASFDLDGKIDAKGAIKIHREIKTKGNGNIELVSKEKIHLYGDVSTEGGNITFNGDVNVDDSAPTKNVFSVVSNGGDINFKSIDGIRDTDGNGFEKDDFFFTLNLNAAKDIDTGGKINGEVKVLSLNLAGEGGDLTGTLGMATAVKANPQEAADSIRFIPGYKFGEFYFNGKLATLGFSPDLVRIIIRGVAPLKTVLNDKLFSAGLSKGKLDENMTASDAKIVDSENAPKKCGSKVDYPEEIGEVQAWSLLGVNADVDAKNEECEEKSDDIQAKTKNAVNKS